ncbi:tetraspanin-15-like isoform X2 [Pelobates cultripes]|uniref:Tetraspanin-15 n=1 Tax=Pelobates cultripes TaxID=61616 RepID=A0AAD1RMB3_PELCU|nr:tetraspanin-15-like isoform X2 [Pelobates cultripes]
MAGKHTWKSYYGIKFSLSFYSTLFSLIGLVILCIGIYAESERRKHQTLEGIFLAPAIILVLLGFLMFVVSFIGMVGSLRDNLLLIKIFFYVLVAIFIIELLLLAIELVFEDQFKKFAHANVLVGIQQYYDDLDFKNIMDFVQEKFSCCGGDEFKDWMVNQYHSCNSTGPLSCGVPYTCCITGKFKKFAHANVLVGIQQYYDDLDFKNIMDFVQEKFSCCGGDEFKDWMVNQYHSCNSTGPLSCGVPYTCCITGKEDVGVKNTLCGYQTLNKERLDVIHIIHVRGCIHAVGLWLNDNFGITFAIVFSFLTPQALGILLSYFFWRRLKEICPSYDEVDFRRLKDINFKELDLSGAGCCYCLPKEEGYIPINMESDDETFT